MPIYDYVCTGCATRIEVMHGVNEAGPQVCTVCGATLRKALSPPAIVFKGSGWAKKDARSAKPATGVSADGNSKDGSPKGDAAKPADKPAGDAAKSAPKDSARD